MDWSKVAGSLTRLTKEITKTRTDLEKSGRAKGKREENGRQPGGG